MIQVGSISLIFPKCVNGNNVGAILVLNGVLYLLADVCVEGESFALEKYVKECLHNILG